MERLVEIVDAAEREVLTHHIESTRGLRSFLLQDGGEALLSSLQEEAVKRGLYRYMGQRYAEALKDLLAQTRQCIAFGRIRTNDQLKRYLIELAASLVPYSDLDLAINDLLIHARQTGMPSLLASTAAKNLPHHGSPYDRDPATQHRIRSGTEA